MAAPKFDTSLASRFADHVRRRLAEQIAGYSPSDTTDLAGTVEKWLGYMLGLPILDKRDAPKHQPEQTAVRALQVIMIEELARAQREGVAVPVRVARRINKPLYK